MIAYFFHRKQSGRRAILSYSAKEPGRLQITYFFFNKVTEMWEPLSDSIRDKAGECLNQLEDEGYLRERVKRFDLFERPEAFQPTEIRPIRLRGREDYVLRLFGVI